MASLLSGSESDEEITQEAAPKQDSKSCAYKACRNALVALAFGGIVLWLIYGNGKWFGGIIAIYYFVMTALPLAFAVPPQCFGDDCVDRCGLPLPRRFDEEFNWKLQRDRERNLVVVNGSAYELYLSQYNERWWEASLPGCFEVIIGDVVSATSAAECAASCRKAQIAMRPECIFEGLVSAPVRACSKAFVSEFVRQAPASSRVGVVLLHTLASIATAVLSMPSPSRTDASAEGSSHAWQQKMVKAPLPWRIFASKMEAGTVAKLDIGMRGANMVFDRLSDVWSITIYLRAGQPVFAFLSMVSLCAGGDPLQIEGLQAVQQSWREGAPNRQLLHNSVHEGFFEGTIGVIIPLAALSPVYGSPDLASVVSLAVSAASSLYSVFSAVQAVELLGAMDSLDKYGKPLTYLDQLALLKKLAGRGLLSLRIFSVACVLATPPCAFGVYFAVFIVCLSICNFLASGMEISRRSLFPMAISPYPMMTQTDSDDAPQHGLILFLYRVLFLGSSSAFKFYVTTVRVAPIVTLMYGIQGLAGAVALLLLLLAAASECSCLRCCCCCCADPSRHFWSRTSAEEFTGELTKSWDAEEVLEEDELPSEYMPVSSLQLIASEEGGQGR